MIFQWLLHLKISIRVKAKGYSQTGHMVIKEQPWSVRPEQNSDCLSLLQIMAGRCPQICVPSGSTWTSCSPQRPSCTSALSLWTGTSAYGIRSNTAASTPAPRPAWRSWQCGPSQQVSTSHDESEFHSSLLFQISEADQNVSHTKFRPTVGALWVRNILQLCRMVHHVNTLWSSGQSSISNPDKEKTASRKVGS